MWRQFASRGLQFGNRGGKFATPKILTPSEASPKTRGFCPLSAVRFTPGRVQAATLIRVGYGAIDARHQTAAAFWRGEPGFSPGAGHLSTNEKETPQCAPCSRSP